MLAVALLIALQAHAAPTTRADSQAILGRAQAAQAAFERIRRLVGERQEIGLRVFPLLDELASAARVA